MNFCSFHSFVDIPNCNLEIAVQIACVSQTPRAWFSRLSRPLALQMRVCLQTIVQTTFKQDHNNPNRLLNTRSQGVNPFPPTGLRRPNIYTFNTVPEHLTKHSICLPIDLQSSTYYTSRKIVKIVQLLSFKCETADIFHSKMLQLLIKRESQKQWKL